MTLYDKLKPEIKAKLEENYKEYSALIDVSKFSSDLSYYTPNGAVIAYVNAGAYVTLQLYQGAGTAQTDVGLDTTFSGALIG